MSRAGVPILLVVVGTAVTACAPLDDVSGRDSTKPTVWHALIETAVEENDLVHGIALRVDAPAIDWQGAAGVADPVSGEPMTAGHPVRIASNTKTFIAIAVLRLWEQGRLDLDDPIEAHLAPQHVEMLRGDGYEPGAITVRHLLTHTSGLFDHSSVDAYVDRILADPAHRWTRTEQLAGAVEWGDPHGAPGEYYTYCDTGYVLLGEVVERAGGRPMAAAVRDLVGYERLGMTATWWEVLEPPPEGVPERAHQFLGEIDTFAFAPSYDLWGGGGVVCTVGDLARLWRGLADGEVFDEPATLDVMLSTIPGAAALPDAGDGALPPGAYRMGLWEAEVAGHRAWRHTGFFGTSATWVPELDLVVAVTVNQNRARELLDTLPEEIIEIVSR